MYSVFRDLAIIILSAKFFALVARKCKAPQVVGEIIAGLIIGPCPGDRRTVQGRRGAASQNFGGAAR